MSQYRRQTLTDIKREIDSNTIIVGNFNTSLTPMDRSSKQKINKETHVLNDAFDEMDLIDFFSTCWLFRNVLFNLHVFVFLTIFFLVIDIKCHSTVVGEGT